MKPIAAPPTERQREVLRFIETYVASHGYPPTLREIGHALGIASTNAVSDHLSLLRRKGLLTWASAKTRGLSRTMKVAPAPRIHSLEELKARIIARNKANEVDDDGMITALRNQRTKGLQMSEQEWRAASREEQDELFGTEGITVDRDSSGSVLRIIDAHTEPPVRLSAHEGHIKVAVPMSYASPKAKEPETPPPAAADKSDETPTVVAAAPSDPEQGSLLASDEDLHKAHRAGGKRK